MTSIIMNYFQRKVVIFYANLILVVANAKIINCNTDINTMSERTKMGIRGTSNFTLGEHKSALPKMNWESYQEYEVIMDYCHYLAERFPFVSYESIGVSTEGREIPFVRIGQGNKPGIFLDGGIHAREWISVATVTYIMEKLVHSPEMLEMFDWYIVPIINVDGYKYTFTTDRSCRKTRSGTPGPEGCLQGVDANRNFDFHWGETGSSDDPCNFFYRGPSPFSEPETAALAKIILSLKEKLKMYISFHCFGQFVLLPWGYSEDASEKPDDYNELLRLAEIGTAALEATGGRKYRCGTGSELVWAAAGSSCDWAKGVAGIKYSYTFELPPLRAVENGYILPEDQIKPTGEETFSAISAMATELSKTLTHHNYNK